MHDRAAAGPDPEEKIKRKPRSIQPDLTEGPLLGKIIRFILPIMAMNLLQNLYNAADMIVVGYSGVPGAIGSIGTTSAVNNFFLNLFIGFSIGANIMVARHIGAKDERATREAVHTAICVNAILGVVIAAAAILAAPRILEWIGDEGNVLILATRYAQIYYCGIPFISLTNCCINIFRAKGDSQTPMYVLAASGLVNVGLNFFFVLVCGMSVEGVALATVISQLLSAAALLLLLSRDEGWCRLDVKRLRITKGALQNQLSMGIPAAIQGCVFSISNMMIQSSIVSMNNLLDPGGSSIIDGNAAASSIEMFLYTCCFSCNQAAVTFTSQNLGARKYERLRRIRLEALLLSIGLSMTLAVLGLALREPLVRLYVTDPASMEAAYAKMNVLFKTYFLVASMEITSGFLRGLGKSLLSTIFSLVGCCVLRVLWVLFLVPVVGTLEIIYIAYPVTWGVTALAGFIAGEIHVRKLIAGNSREAAASAG